MATVVVIGLGDLGSRVLDILARSRRLAPLVRLPLPHNVGPALAPLGLSPELGAGNVTERAVKLELLAREGAEARLLLHHAAQRYAFPDFAALGGGETEEPPWAAEVRLG